MSASNRFLERQTMQKRLAANPTDAQAVEFFAQEERQKLIMEQYRHAMEEYPESFGRVLMLYIAATINGHAVQAFCDSGAQSTIMSKRLAVQCGIADCIDTRFKGIAVGVGTGVILGKIHMVQLQIGAMFFPCSVTVMDDPPPGSQAKEMPFLFGLDMMKRHMCLIDLQRGCLRFPTGSTNHGSSSSSSYMDAPFLHEKDLSLADGGTKGFDADKANEELLALLASRKDGPGDVEDDAME
jgi:DNA damage-inducible protein 1